MTRRRGRARLTAQHTVSSPPVDVNTAVADSPIPHNNALLSSGSGYTPGSNLFSDPSSVQNSRPVESSQGLSFGTTQYPFYQDSSGVDWDDFMYNFSTPVGPSNDVNPSVIIPTEVMSEQVAQNDLPNADTAFQTPPHISGSQTDFVTGSLDCLQSILLVLNDVHVPKPSCGLGGQKGSPAAPTVDLVLSRNKQIVQTLEKVIACNCSLDRQLAPLIAITISKVLNWYAAAATSDNESQPPRPKKARLAGSIEHVLHTPISFGAYKVEGIDVARVRSQLILQEAEARIVPLLDAYERRFCSTDGPEKTLARFSIPISRYTEGLLREKLAHFYQLLKASDSSKASKDNSTPSTTISHKTMIQTSNAHT